MALCLRNKIDMTFRAHKRHIGMLRLIILFSAVGLFSHVAYSAGRCSAALTESTSKARELPPQAKRFWSDLGNELKRNLDYDFQRPPNKPIYQEQIRQQHPAVEFYKSLGFEITSDGTFRTPSSGVLFANLQIQITRLNKLLKESGADIQINPKIFLDLINDETGLKQKVVLDPLQVFWAPGYHLEAESNILKTEAFFKFVSEGNFPIGGTASASGLARSLVELEKTQIASGQVSDYSAKPSLSDFLHDLGHISAFLRNPEFAKTYVRVFRHHYTKAQRMTPEEKKAYFQTFNESGTRNWRRMFYFSESSWLTHPDYQTRFRKWPTIQTILRGKESTLVENNRTQILRELREIKSEWWKLFDPLGGAVNDMISHDAFHSAVRSNFIVQRVLRELEVLLKNENPFGAESQGSLKIVLGFLKHSPRLTLGKWEYFARSDGWESSEVISILKDIFPAENIQSSKDWGKLYQFLYGQ
jgi:hypothetical protein